eukprot:m51a1_g9425 hypothetical protein (174) ;mRNA; f:387552-388146
MIATGPSLAAALGLLALAAAVAATNGGSPCCTGPGALIYDAGDNYRPVARSHIGVQPLCHNQPVFQASVAQLVTPPSIPWQLTRVCFALHLLPARNHTPHESATVYGTVSLYTMALLPLAGPGDRTSFVSFRQEISSDEAQQNRQPGGTRSNTTMTPVWVTLDVGNLDSPMGA